MYPRMAFVVAVETERELMHLWLAVGHVPELVTLSKLLEQAMETTTPTKKEG
jgi:hypothetical protein